MTPHIKPPIEPKQKLDNFYEGVFGKKRKTDWKITLFIFVVVGIPSLFFIGELIISTIKG